MYRAKIDSQAVMRMQHNQACQQRQESYFDVYTTACVMHQDHMVVYLRHAEEGGAGFLKLHDSHRAMHGRSEVQYITYQAGNTGCFAQSHRTHDRNWG